MGGLKTKLPTTYWTFVVGSLALAGFPLTAGFFSKDEILVAAWSSGSLGQVLAIAGLLTALLTAFYSFRLVFVTFWGESHVDPHHADHVHEPSRTMTTPLLILSIFSILTGYLGIPSFLEPVFATGQDSVVHHGGSGVVIMIAATLLGLIGIAAAYYAYVLRPDLPERLAQQWNGFYQGSLNKWYVDEVYDRLFVQPTCTAAAALWKRIDIAVIDGAVNGVGKTITWGGWILRLIQSGQTQHYALAMAMGIVIITAYLLL